MTIEIPIGLSYDDVLLVPRRSKVESRSEVKTESTIAKGITLASPIISANMDTVTEAPMAIAIAREGGLGIIHRFLDIKTQVEEVVKTKEAEPSHKRVKSENPAKDVHGKLLVGAAIGIKGDYVERANALAAAEVDIIVLDIAHGHTDSMIAAIKKIKKDMPNMPLVAGNVATAEAVEDLAAAGADIVKIGIGPGAACTTRRITGAGMPQLTAVIDCYAAAERAGIKIIADGGIRESGDITNALAAGAAAVMIGSLFAGTDESPGYFITRDGVRYKAYRGMASLGANISRRTLNGVPIDPQEVYDIVPEGVESIVPYRGTMAEVMIQLIGGVKSGMSYSGALNLEELRKNARFIRLTNSAAKESYGKLSPR